MDSAPQSAQRASYTILFRSIAGRGGSAVTVFALGFSLASTLDHPDLFLKQPFLFGIDYVPPFWLVAPLGPGCALLFSAGRRRVALTDVDVILFFGERV